MTWAFRRGSDTPAVRALRKAGASSAPMILRAAENALALLQKSGPQFTKVSGCASCHHQSLPQMANGIARTRGVRIDEQVAQQQVKAVIATFSPLREEMMRGIVRFPDVPISVSYTLLGLAAEGYPADETTAAMAHLIGLQQLADGSFRTIPARPPLESSDFTATSLSLRALQLYGETEADRIQRAASMASNDGAANLGGPRDAVARHEMGQHGRESAQEARRSCCYRCNKATAAGLSCPLWEAMRTPPGRRWWRSNDLELSPHWMPPTSVAWTSSCGPS